MIMIIEQIIIGTSCCTAASQVFSFPVITVCPVRFVYVCHLGEVFQVREDMNTKKTFSFRHCPNEGGGVYTCPNFLALFLEVHFWSIKRVYFFKNANVLNF